MYSVGDKSLADTEKEIPSDFFVAFRNRPFVLNFWTIESRMRRLRDDIALSAVQSACLAVGNKEGGVLSLLIKHYLVPCWNRLL